MHDYTKNLGYWIKRYSVLANRTIDNTLKPYGIGRTQWYILHYIHEQGVVQQRKLQEFLQVESATLTSLVGSLVRKDFIAQIPDPNDKRSKHLALTDKGKAAWQSLPNPIEAVKAKALDGIKPKDIERARKVLEAAVHNLENTDI